MPTPFAGSIWQKSTFVFTVHSNPQAIDERGNVSSQGRAIALTLKMRPSGGSPVTGEAADTAGVSYDCRLVAINGDYNKFILPPEIRLNDIGTGELRGRKCRVIVKSISQSSVAPVVEPILGSAVRLEIDYRIRRGSGNAQA